MIRFLLTLCLVLFISSCAWFTGKSKEDIEGPESDVAADMLITAENFVSDGIAHFQNGNDSLAVISWQRALELIPGDAEVHNFIGISYHKLNKLKKAENHFHSATKLDTNYYQAFNNHGYLLFLDKNYNEAASAFEKALTINPNYEPARLNYEKTKKIMSGEILREVFELTELAEKIDDPDKQIEYYTRVLEIDPMYAEGHNNIAVAYYYADNVDEAYKHLNEAIKLDRNYPEALNNLGYIYKVAERYQDAVTLFLKAISVKGKYIIALNNLAETYYLKGEKENSVRVFQTVLDIEPADEFAKDMIGRVK